MLTVGKIMSTVVTSFPPDAALAAVAAEMSRRAISCVVVCDGGRPQGVISERDLAHVLCRTLSGDGAPTLASEAMSSPPVTIEQDASIPQAMETIRKHHIRRLVVVDEFGDLAGLITQTDLLRSHADAIEAARNSLEDLVVSRTTQLEEANRQLEAMALKDALLGIGNRRAMEIELAKQQALAERYDRGFAVALLDVDHFKRYNDSYGHPDADHVLQQIAKTLSHVIRGTDTIYRYGGEEILLLLPETGIEGARRAGERARNAVQALAIPHQSSEHGVVTISAGVAAFTMPADASVRTWESLVQRADRGLYLAKSQGRNRTCAAMPPGMLAVTG